MTKVYEPNLDPSYYEDEKETDSYTKLAAVVAFGLEIGVAVVSMISFEGFEECCGEYFFMAKTPESQEKWDRANFWVAVTYLGIAAVQLLLVARRLIIVPIFNPLIGFYLVLSAIYGSDEFYAIIMYGLETAAVICATFMLFRERRYYSLFVQVFVCYFASGFTLYLIVKYRRQGGYCVFGGLYEMLFQEQICDIPCDDIEVPCSFCDIEKASCFIQF